MRENKQRAKGQGGPGRSKNVTCLAATCTFGRRLSTPCQLDRKTLEERLQRVLMPA